jgi:5-methylcytosine-specific restriction endonuclease McrA
MGTKVENEDYIQYRKDVCEECGAKNYYMAGNYRVRRKILTAHHKDHNHSNNDPANIQTLCRKCHNKKHLPSPEEQLRQRRAKEERKKRHGVIFY